jgi:hypothetical protein
MRLFMHRAPPPAFVLTAEGWVPFTEDVIAL